jgi:hypothetical protein
MAAGGGARALSICAQRLDASPQQAVPQVFRQPVVRRCHTSRTRVAK